MSFESFSTPEHNQRDQRLPYLPGLDGLRAIAVSVVLLYHAGAGFYGGFLGVETFFVISGFLITALLLADWRTNGRVGLAAFWARRARRLLPALFALLGGTLLFAALALPAEFAAMLDDTLAAIAYVMNWQLIWSGQSYFDPLARPPLLQHLWSLAVEEQFYLLWPLLFAAGMRWLRPRGLLIATLAVAAASAVWMALLYQPDSDPSRVYYGTDTRATGLLLGAALAMVWAPGHVPAAGRRSVGLVLDGAGLLALGALFASFIWLDEYQPLLYQGGFAAIALATAVTIMAVTHPQARLGRLLGLAPLRWLGLRSYGIYLWHWPVFMVTRPYLDVPLEGWTLFWLRLVIVLGLAELSYRLVELPVRRHALDRLLRTIWAARLAPQPGAHGRSRRHIGEKAS